jgi:hypothetical protein
MSEDERSPGVMKIETADDFMQHIEAGGNKIRVLAVTSVVVAILLIAAYILQLLLPFTTNTKVVEVNLADPSLMALELFLVALGAAWLYLGFREYQFTTRLRKQVKEVRTLQREVLKKAGFTDDELADTQHRSDS